MLWQGWRGDRDINSDFLRIDNSNFSSEKSYENTPCQIIAIVDYFPLKRSISFK